MRAVYKFDVCGICLRAWVRCILFYAVYIIYCVCVAFVCVCVCVVCLLVCVRVCVSNIPMLFMYVNVHMHVTN